MNTNERDAINRMTEIAGESSVRVGDYSFRRISPESLGLMQLIGSPFARAVTTAEEGQDTATGPTMVLDVGIMLWLHAAPWEEVTETCLECSPVLPIPARRAALNWLHTHPMSMEDMQAAVRVIIGQVVAVQAAAFEARAPETRQKNEGAPTPNGECARAGSGSHAAGTPAGDDGRAGAADAAAALHAVSARSADTGGDGDAMATGQRG